jgi:hypothetical protein
MKEKFSCLSSGEKSLFIISQFVVSHTHTHTQNSFERENFRLLPLFFIYLFSFTSFFSVEMEKKNFERREMMYGFESSLRKARGAKEKERDENEEKFSVCCNSSW